MANFVKMHMFTSSNKINIYNIDDFIKIINDNNIENIFFGKCYSRHNTREKCFLININSMVYIYSYCSKYGVFSTIDDYKESLEKGYTNATDYYFSKSFKITDYTEYHNYLLQNYGIDDVEVKDEVEEYIEVVEKITQIENSKIEYGFNNDQAIIYNIIKENHVDQKINIHFLHNKCDEGIIIKQREYFRGDCVDDGIQIKISEKINNACMEKVKVVEYFLSQPCESEKYKLEFSIEKFENEIKTILNKTSLRIEFTYEEREEQNRSHY
jgi:hypothetical protein